LYVNEASAQPIERHSARASAESRAARTIREILESGRPIIYIRSSEEQRVSRLLSEVSRAMAGGVPVFEWSLTEGMRSQEEDRTAGTQSPRGVLDFIAGHQGAAIFHLKDFHEPLRDSAEVRRRLRDIYESCRDRQKFAVISAPVHAIPEELERTILYLELRTPDLVELIDFLRDETGNSNEDLLLLLARALQGLTLDEARYALRRALAGGRTLCAESMPTMLEEKRLLINRSGVIEFISDGGSFRDVGGLDGLKKWLQARRKLFMMRDSIDAEIVPKGILMMGIPGCGKSLSVKAIASDFQLPLYRVDMVAIFSGRHGKPEVAFVDACKMMEDMAPAVLWFDEIEMGVNSAASTGEQGRIFAFFLTWMQEKTRGLFVAATANRIDRLPAEMIRKGRFDEVFFVDLPQDEERVEIFRIHLDRRGIDSSPFDLDQLKQFTQGWSGAEIEQCVVSAITTAKLADRELTGHDLVTTAVKIVPLSRTMKEQINQIRAWAFERAVRASPSRGPGA
jgi:SpoVK/Ycf46/Vps4 family AAA+-type ATPase